MAKAFMPGKWVFNPSGTWVMDAGSFSVDVYCGAGCWVTNLYYGGTFIERLINGSKQEAMQSAVDWITDEVEQIQMDLEELTELKEEASDLQGLYRI